MILKACTNTTSDIRIRQIDSIDGIIIRSRFEVILKPYLFKPYLTFFFTTFFYFRNPSGRETRNQLHPA